MAVPNIFGSATSAIPLSQLDQNFATAITLGNTAVYLGNTTTSLGNVTLTNVTISSGNVSVSTATVGAGTAAAPSITTTGDTNTGIFFPAADTIAFSEGGVESMRIDASGNMGLGVVPSAWDTNRRVFQFGGSGALWTSTSGNGTTFLSNNMYFDGTNFRYLNTGGASYYALASDGSYAWNTAASGTAGNTISFTQAMTLDASGNLGVGATSPSAKLQVDAPNFALATSYNTLSSNFAVRTTTTQAANVGGEIALGGYSNGTSGTTDFARIHGKKENSTAGNVSGYLAFEVSNDGGPAPYIFERARIDSSGNLLVGTTSPLLSSVRRGISVLAPSGIYVAASFANDAGAVAQTMDVWNKATTGNNGFVSFFTEAGGTERGNITYNRAGGLTAYNTTSDYRAKDISGPVINSGALIDSVPVYMGKMKGATQERPMFIAHEVPAYAHTGEKDAVDKDGNPVYQQMDASALIPVMWAEIQSLRKRITALEQA